MDPHASHESDGSRAWQAPTLTELGTLHSQTSAQTQGMADFDISGGSIAGDSGTISS